MNDWNGDGRRDLKDDVFYLSEIDKKVSDKVDIKIGDLKCLYLSIAIKKKVK